MSWLTLRYQNTSTESLLLYHLLLRAFGKGMLFYTWWASLSCFAPAKCNSSLSSSSSLPVHSPANQWQLLLCVMCRSSWLTPGGRSGVPREIHGRWIDVDLGSRIRIRMGIEDEQQKIGGTGGRKDEWLGLRLCVPWEGYIWMPLGAASAICSIRSGEASIPPTHFHFWWRGRCLSVPHERHKRMIRMGTE